MKLKVFLAGLAVAALAASSAVAAPPEGKGKPRTGDGCKPQIAVVLKGKLTSASATSLTMSVTGANRWGRAWKNAGTATAALNDKTRVRGGGMKSITDLLAKLKAGDRVLVQARVCKDDLKVATAMPALTATKVIGHPAKAENEDDD
jgi:opacity protein-like surface antigen